MSQRILEVNNLRTYFYTNNQVIPAVDGISFYMKKGETLGVVGESGCGKTITALSIMGLIPTPPGKYLSGQILYKGENLQNKSYSQLRKIRGKEISMIFQEPTKALNPVYKIGQQIVEAIREHKKVTRKTALFESIDLLKSVKIPDPERRIFEYPHQLSGGMLQRIMIAMAISCNPSILIADEPTTAVDVTIQAQLINLLNTLKSQYNMSMLFITHDLGVIAEIANRVIVMYAGKIIENSSVYDLFNDPRHPYTQGLLKAIPRLDIERKRLKVIRGNVPNPSDFPSGCRFHTRCEFAYEICISREPPIKELSKERWVSCWLEE